MTSGISTKPGWPVAIGARQRAAVAAAAQITSSTAGQRCAERTWVRYAGQL
jgi:hypothetical protein